MSGNEIVEAAFADFDAWVKCQPDEVQEMDTVEQAELFVKERMETLAEQRMAA